MVVEYRTLQKSFIGLPGVRTDSMAHHTHTHTCLALLHLHLYPDIFHLLQTCVYNCLLHIPMWILIDNSKRSELTLFHLQSSLLQLMVISFFQQFWPKILELSLMPLLFHTQSIRKSSPLNISRTLSLLPSPLLPLVQATTISTLDYSNNLLIGHTAFILSPNLFLIQQPE